ncbi:hypothetical protein HETIRDRAFT_312097, partial [Heterobasidion irregulare TC 32-1]
VSRIKSPFLNRRLLLTVTSVCFSQNSIYWGFVKYRYCEVYKERFDDTKKHARKCLNNCPIEVIRHFFNCLWHFIDAYHRGLTKKVVE